MTACSTMLLRAVTQLAALRFTAKKIRSFIRASLLKFCFIHFPIRCAQESVTETYLRLVELMFLFFSRFSSGSDSGSHLLSVEFGQTFQNLRAVVRYTRP